MQEQHIIQHIVSWLKDYSDSSKTQGFVVGISGGIDSALTSTLCAETTKPLLCVSLPIHQHESEFLRAKEQIAFLKTTYSNVSSLTVDLTEAFEATKAALPKKIHTTLNLANLRARLRMSTLYAMAGGKGMLVAGTGNKVEDFGVGFYTKYGDGGVDISPIADLMKSEVRAIASELNIPQSILHAAPTDGLFADGRTDEDQIGASYDELEWAMRYAEKGGSLDILTGREREVFQIYTNRNRANKHKMEPIPVCIVPEFLKL